jgi:hypothetical protein
VRARGGKRQTTATQQHEHKYKKFCSFWLPIFKMDFCFFFWGSFCLLSSSGDSWSLAEFSKVLVEGGGVVGLIVLLVKLVEAKKLKVLY